MEALVIASVVPVAVFAGYVLQPLTVSSGYRPVRGSLVFLLCRAKMVLGQRGRGVAVEVGVLSVAARRRGPGCHAANTSHAICLEFLCGPSNSQVGSSAIEHAGRVAWLRACSVG
jgi:hypothetical protein